jgi:predicted HNH restriction endonuclease
LSQYHWRPQASGTAIPDELVADLDRLWRDRVGSALNPDRAPDLSDDECSAFEGAERRRFVLHRRREHRLRERKVQMFRREHRGRLYCEVDGCGFDFERVYGRLGNDYAQVHHLEPLAAGDSRKTELRDLAVVCANCHAMVHRNGRSRTIKEVSAAIKRRAR